MFSFIIPSMMSIRIAPMKPAPTTVTIETSDVEDVDSGEMEASYNVTPINNLLMSCCPLLELRLASESIFCREAMNDGGQVN